MNIPLSAYTIQQDITNNPNASMDRMPSYSSLIPSSLRQNAGDFTPHTFTIGDTFLTNFSLFASYTILAAYDRQDSPGSPVPLASNTLSGFAYKNYDLSQCDVLGITISIDLGNTSLPVVQVVATVSCWFPVFFLSHVDLWYTFDTTNDPLQIMSVINSTFRDLDQYMSSYTSVTFNRAEPSADLDQVINGTIDIISKQCCTRCGDHTHPSLIGPDGLEKYEIISPDNHILLYDHPSCDSKDVEFKSDFIANGNLFMFLQNIDDIISPPELPLVINNTIRALYHAIRLDLGVIRPNQIYNSPTRFNASIANWTLPVGETASGAYYTRTLRDAIGEVDLSNSTYMVHVPDILYFTPVFKQKPLGQAISAVFVSTFSMLSAIWAAFTFVASAIVTVRSKPGKIDI